MVAQFGTNTADIVFYSDDSGISWAPSVNRVPDCNEAQIVELANGTLLMNARSERAKPAGMRRLAVSNDGGTTWSTGHLVGTFAGTNCMGSMLTCSPGNQRQSVLFSHPNQHGGGAASNRSNGTIWISTDDAASFAPVLSLGSGTAKERANQLFAYSCMSEVDPGSAVFGILYETGDASCTGKSASCAIVFSNFTLPHGVC